MSSKDGKTAEPAQVTALLLAWNAGNAAALDELTPLVHNELHRVARRLMAGERAGHTLQPTALVNEAFLRLVDVRQIQWQNRAHFLAMAARTMRRVLVDLARAKQVQKRGESPQRVVLDDAALGSDERPRDVVALHEAMEALATFDLRKSQVVELRFFGGLSVEETGEVLQVSPETVMRDWKLARVWLLRELMGNSGTSP